MRNLIYRRIAEIEAQENNHRFLTRKWANRTYTFFVNEKPECHEYCFIYHNKMYESMSDEDLIAFFELLVKHNYEQ